MAIAKLVNTRLMTNTAKMKILPTMFIARPPLEPLQ